MLKYSNPSLTFVMFKQNILLRYLVKLFFNNQLLFVNMISLISNSISQNKISSFNFQFFLEIIINHLGSNKHLLKIYLNL
jgi:hypothetical protein